MLGSTVVLAVMTALAGHVSAQSCTVGQVYCGATLMRPPSMCLFSSFFPFCYNPFKTICSNFDFVSE